VGFRVSLLNRQTGELIETEISGDRYILNELEDRGIPVPAACLNGACTTCAMRLKSGKVNQPEAIGLSQQLQQAGYALVCVGYACTDLELETQDENEVYALQFSQYFVKQRKPLFRFPWDL
jgi:ferredoxin